jgi:IS1 family transposase
MRRSTRSSATAPTRGTNAERPFAVRRVAPPAALVASPLWVTPLYRLKTASHRVAEVLTAVAEGLDVSAAAQLFGHRPATSTSWLSRAGEHSMRLHDRVFHNLYLPHIQFDELRTRLRKRAHVLWLWVAVDPLTKIIPVLKLGARTQDFAHATVHELRERLVVDCIPVCTSDGLNHAFYALTAHFGQWVAGTGRRGRQWLLRRRTDLWTGEEALSATETGARQSGDALLSA